MLISHLVIAWRHARYPMKYADRFILSFAVIALKSFVLKLYYVNTIIHENGGLWFLNIFIMWES